MVNIRKDRRKKQPDAELFDVGKKISLDIDNAGTIEQIVDCPFFKKSKKTKNYYYPWCEDCIKGKLYVIRDPTGKIIEPYAYPKEGHCYLKDIRELGVVD